VWLEDEPRYVVTIPAERLDLRIKEDLIEEIGRIYGYENISHKKVNPYVRSLEINRKAYYCDLIRNSLVDMGFSEVYTYAFTGNGQVELQNPLAVDKAFLRESLVSGLENSLALNTPNMDLLGCSQIKIFEIGNVFPSDKEYLSLGLVVKNQKGHKGKSEDEEVEDTLDSLKDLFGQKFESTREGSVHHLDLGSVIAKLPELKETLPYEHDDSSFKYKNVSQYPFVLRDIAAFVPTETGSDNLQEVIKKESGDLLVNASLFDEFKKDNLVSYAFRLVFQSQKKTLTDDEVNVIMNNVTKAIKKKGWQVR
jgi:phenylalanyl-tRNA synthetase beta chain